MLLYCLLFATVCCLAGTGLAATSAAAVVLLPEADTYLDATTTGTHGADPVLRMDEGGEQQALLRFALVSVPAERRVVSATLRLYAAEVTPSSRRATGLKTSLGLFNLDTPWVEATAAFTTADGTTPWRQGPGFPQPAYEDVSPVKPPDLGLHLSRPYVGFDVPQVAAGKWMEFDVTEFLRNRLRAHVQTVSFVLRAAGLSQSYTFPSRESVDAAHQPQLVVNSAELPDFRLEPVIVTNWHSGQPVTVRIAPAPSDAKVAWAFTRKPAESTLAEAALQVGAGAATFVPDRCGRYRVRATVATATTASSETADVLVLTVPPHPRLYVTADRLDLLRTKAQAGDALFAAIRARVDSANAETSEGASRARPGSCEENALLYLITRDPQYAQRSTRDAERILEKPMPEHFRDSHEATYTGASWVHAMAVHYDWCYDRLTPEHRRAVAKWLKEAAAWSAARSGSVLAHNDGGAKTLILAIVPAALAGDDPDAVRSLRVYHDFLDHEMLPWLRDAGSGGRSGDGGEYEGLHGFFLVRAAWATDTATGEDLFAEAPFYYNRLRHLLFGWYPGWLRERTGRYAIRQYYSPGGDHLRMGHVGDSRPYAAAAVLCDHYRDREVAQNVRWLAGDWPSAWTRPGLHWAFLTDFNSVPAKEPTTLSYLDRGFNTLYTRSDWSDDATWVLLENGPWVSVHQSLDKGGFEIFKGDLLAARTGNYDGGVSSLHTTRYLHRTISGNCLLIEDPQERWAGFIGGQRGRPDGGGQRTNYPVGSTPTWEPYNIWRSVYQRGHITRYLDRAELTYGFDDITDAYNNPTFHGGTYNRPKVKSVTRQLVYLRELDSVVVYDRVGSMAALFKKRWLLHSLGDLDVLDGKETKVDEGEYHYQGATREVIRYGWAKPEPTFARLQSVTLLPEDPEVVKIGGRVDLPAGQTEQWNGPDDHGLHAHRHLKDFWVAGANYPPGNISEPNWFGDPTAPDYLPGTPDESGGRGKWRIEVSPSVPRQDDVFFHVLSPRLGSEGPFPAVTRLPAGDFDGALVSENGKTAAVFFSHAEKAQSAFSATLPPGTRALLVVADLTPGHYAVLSDGTWSEGSVGPDGLLVVPDAAGHLGAVSPRAAPR